MPSAGTLGGWYGRSRIPSLGTVAGCGGAPALPRLGTVTGGGGQDGAGVWAWATRSIATSEGASHIAMPSRFSKRCQRSRGVGVDVRAYSSV